MASRPPRSRKSLLAKTLPRALRRIRSKTKFWILSIGATFSVRKDLHLFPIYSWTTRNPLYMRYRKLGGIPTRKEDPAHRGSPYQFPPRVTLYGIAEGPGGTLLGDMPRAMISLSRSDV